MTDLINTGDKNPAYATYVGRVGALALALGIGAAMATGHGLGLGVAYATEGDPPSDTSQDNDANDNNGDDTGATPPAPSGARCGARRLEPASVAVGANRQRPEDDLQRHRWSSEVERRLTTQPRLPRLTTVLEDVASAVTREPAQASSTRARRCARRGIRAPVPGCRSRRRIGVQR